jgi:hypothetical protein
MEGKSLIKLCKVVRQAFSDWHAAVAATSSWMGFKRG